MKAASLHEIKEELSGLKSPELIALCLRLSRFKKENKELLTYLLFEAHREQDYIAGIKTEVDDLFEEINLSHLYFAKKSLRKIVRIINKYSRYSSVKQTELDLRLHFCSLLKNSGIPLRKNAVIKNLYEAQIKKSRNLVATLHEDLQYDYKRLLEELD